MAQENKELALFMLNKHTLRSDRDGSSVPEGMKSMWKASQIYFESINKNPDDLVSGMNPFLNIIKDVAGASKKGKEEWAKIFMYDYGPYVTDPLDIVDLVREELRQQYKAQGSQGTVDKEAQEMVIDLYKKVHSDDPEIQVEIKDRIACMNVIHRSLFHRHALLHPISNPTGKRFLPDDPEGIELIKEYRANPHRVETNIIRLQMKYMEPGLFELRKAENKIFEEIKEKTNVDLTNLSFEDIEYFGVDPLGVNDLINELIPNTQSELANDIINFKEVVNSGRHPEYRIKPKGGKNPPRLRLS